MKFLYISGALLFILLSLEDALGVSVDSHDHIINHAISTNKEREKESFSKDSIHISVGLMTSGFNRGEYTPFRGSVYKVNYYGSIVGVVKYQNLEFLMGPELNYIPNIEDNIHSRNSYAFNPGLVIGTSYIFGGVNKDRFFLGYLMHYSKIWQKKNDSYNSVLINTTKIEHSFGLGTKFNIFKKMEGKVALYVGPESDGYIRKFTFSGGFGLFYNL